MPTRVESETWDHQRGRVEHRSIRVTSEMNAYLHPTWPHIHQVAQLTRLVTSKKGMKTEIVYLITNLSALQASPERLLAVIRGHWSIENGSHSVRDVTFGEDRSRLHSGNAPQILTCSFVAGLPSNNFQTLTRKSSPLAFRQEAGYTEIVSIARAGGTRR